MDVDFVLAKFITIILPGKNNIVVVLEIITILKCQDKEENHDGYFKFF